MSEIVSEFEQRRLETIRKNQEYLKSLNIEPVEQIVASKRISLPKTKKVRAKVEKRVTAPSRTSRRLSGRGEDDVVLQPVDINVEPIAEYKLLSFEEYFDKETVEKSIKTDGIYRGWLHPDLVEKYNFKKETFEQMQKEPKSILD
jgi:hypothetical protein